MKNLANDSPLVFVLGRNELEDRIDVRYYKPEYRQVYKNLEGSPFKLSTLKRISDKIFSGMTPLSGGPDYTTSDKGIPFVRSGDINERDVIDFDSLLYVKKQVHCQKMKSSRLEKNDLLLAIVGATIGQVALYKYDGEANINQAIAGVRLKKGANPDYVKWFLLTELGQTQLERLKRPVARANINLQEIGEIRVPLPSRETQNSISALMQEALERGTGKEKEAESLLNSIDDYLLQELDIALSQFEGASPYAYEIGAKSMRNKRIDVAYWKPPHRELERSIGNGKYEAMQLGELVDKTINGLDYRDFSDSGTKYLRVGNLKPFGFDETDIKRIPLIPEDVDKEIRLKANDILLTRKGTPGVAALVGSEDRHYIISSEIIRLVPRGDLRMNVFYVVSILNSVIGKNQFLRKSVGAIMGSLTQIVVKSILIPFPPVSTQDRLAAEVKSRIQRARLLKEEAGRIVSDAKERMERILLGKENL